jgi:hypothetical protein
MNWLKTTAKAMENMKLSFVISGVPQHQGAIHELKGRLGESYLVMQRNGYSVSLDASLVLHPVAYA